MRSTTDLIDEGGAHGAPVNVSDEVAAYLNNRKRRELSRVEEDGQIVLQILGSEDNMPEYLAMDCYDDEGSEVKFEPRPIDG